MTRAQAAEGGSAPKALRQHRGFFAFRDVDAAPNARACRLPPYDGAMHLLRDVQGGQHAGCWNGLRWVYSSGATIEPVISCFCARATEQPKLENA